MVQSLRNIPHFLLCTGRVFALVGLWFSNELFQCRNLCLTTFRRQKKKNEWIWFRLTLAVITAWIGSSIALYHDSQHTSHTHTLTCCWLKFSCKLDNSFVCNDSVSPSPLSTFGVVSIVYSIRVFCFHSNWLETTNHRTHTLTLGSHVGFFFNYFLYFITIVCCCRSA